jgi:methionine synthase II (cobalamin-independent)
LNKTNGSQPPIEPQCRATTIGSLPHTDVVQGTALMLETTPEIPAWVQFPKRTFHEGMMVQFTEGMPGLVQDGDHFYFDTTAPDFPEQLTDFYAGYLSVTENGDVAALDRFGLSPAYAAGFTELINRLPEHAASHQVFMLKGQVTGPFTLGTNLLDQDRRCSYYHDQLHDVVVKTVALKAMWQLNRLKASGLPVTIFLDEPSLLGFGSQTFLTVSREDVVGDINEVTAVIHAQGALAGVHCEENTDWSLLMEADLDILDFDAYDHMQAITLYPAELRAFLERGGWLGWGIVPTLDKDAAATETVPSLLARFEEGLQRLVRKDFDQELLLRRALITPSCGAGGVLTEPLSVRVLGLLHDLSRTLRGRHGFV